MNLNTATVAQLETLPGIGKSTAERILEYPREERRFQEDRGPDERTGHRREELPQAEAARHGLVRQGRQRRTVARGRAGRAQRLARGPHGFTVIDSGLLVCGRVRDVRGRDSADALYDRTLARPSPRPGISRLAWPLRERRRSAAPPRLRCGSLKVPPASASAFIQDGNRNGVRARDIDAQIDRTIEAPVRLSELFPGVEIGLTPQTPGTDPVQLGGSNILSFTPHGTASSGSVYIRGRDGTQWVVRVLGATGRTRVLQYVPRSGEWVYAS